MKTALVAGSTGLVGKALVQLLLDSDRYNKVVAITRSSIEIKHPKLEVLKVNYPKLEERAETLRADDVFCCLGTTMAKAKSKERFREVDFTFPLKLAEFSARNGAKQFLLVSALGADKRSSVFYNRVKGELEEAVRKIDFHSLHIFRPSLLLGNRSEQRSAEEAAKFFYKVFWFLIPDKFKGIDHHKVAKAMLHFASREQHGQFVHESREMQHY